MSTDKKKQADHEYYVKNKDKIIKGSTEWNKKNKEYHRKYDKVWRGKNPTKSRSAYLKRTYEISLEEYELLKLIQEGRCAICLEKHQRLVIDHCHKTNAVRSLLCTTCNAGLGQFKDSIKLLGEAIKYLERHESARITEDNSKR